jgi:fatty-acyl-CoA synthase
MRTSDTLAAWVRALENTKAASKLGATLPGLLPVLAAKYAERPALLGEGEAFTYQTLGQRVASVGAWASQMALPDGASVCLLMPNRPDYVAIWLGLAGTGRVVALLNTSLRGEGLLHCIAAADASAVIVADSLLPALQAVAHKLPPGVRVWVHGGSTDQWPTFDPGTSAADASVPQTPIEPGRRALLIYTSGTTGLPKATVITHARIVEWSYWFAGMMDAGPNDRMYDCLPLYHSVGGIIAIGAMLVSGGSVLIRPRFSASRFWNDVTEHGCTIFQYIGELCRYLVNAPPHPLERAHTLRLACGNGLAGDVWDSVQERFAIPRILEFYAATEGGVSLYNVEGKPGAIGRIPPFLQHRMGIVLIQHDPSTGEPVRDALGRCVPSEVDMPGEAIGRLDSGVRRFDGYTDQSASSRKLLADVFEPGDRWFRTGDLMRRDEAGFFYFVDRIGDSFRWRGENVSAAEVTAVLRSAPGIDDAAVYGVAIPGHDGRAGMAACTVTSEFDPDTLHAHLQSALPPYAQPLFIRLCHSLDMTDTFKLAKARLAAEGFVHATDPMLFNDHRERRLKPLVPPLVADITRGEMRI